MAEPTLSAASNETLQPPSLTESDYEPNKIFVGGLSRFTTKEGLKKHFERFGEVTETEVLEDKVTGKSRGFGFVTFGSKEAVKAVLRQTHRVEGTEVEVKLAVRREKSKVLAPQYDHAKRIFVGGVSERISESYFRDYFARYGPLSNFNYLVDRPSNRPRGYGFVVYENQEDAEKAVGRHPSLGRNCEAKFASPKGARKTETPLADFDYSAYYYAQANLLYSQYLSQLYNGGAGAGAPEFSTEASSAVPDRPRGPSPDARADRRPDDRRRVRRSRSRSPRRSRSRSRHRHRR